jgi:hypothetical protein
MPKMLSTGFKICGAFILIIIFFTSLFCKSERKSTPTPAYDFNIDSLITSIKSDTTLNADDATFDKKDSLLIVYLVPKTEFRDSATMREHFKSLHVTNAIRRAKNISGLVFVKTPHADSMQSDNYKYQILSSFFKAGTKFAERSNPKKHS